MQGLKPTAAEVMIERRALGAVMQRPGDLNCCILDFCQRYNQFEFTCSCEDCHPRYRAEPISARLPSSAPCENIFFFTLNNFGMILLLH